MSRQRLAVIIEPDSALAQAVADVLRPHGFATLAFNTHAGAARGIERENLVDFLAAAVPAPGEDRAGAYLADARRTHPAMPVVVMLSDPCESMDGVPAHAERLIKPFSRVELDGAIERAMRPVGTGGMVKSPHAPRA